MTLITRIRTPKGAGVLADRAAKDAFPVFPRYSLVYGFNGSGKSTLFRLLSSLQTGKSQNDMLNDILDRQRLPQVPPLEPDPDDEFPVCRIDDEDKRKKRDKRKKDLRDDCMTKFNHYSGCDDWADSNADGPSVGPPPGYTSPSEDGSPDGDSDGDGK